MDLSEYFIENKYYKYYFYFVDKWKSRDLKEFKEKVIFVERHHIYPVSLKIEDTANILLAVSLKEHLFLHHLLTKFTIRKYKCSMLFAYHLMLHGRQGNLLKMNINDQQKSEKDFANAMSKLQSGRKRSKEQCENISKALTGKPKSEEHKEALRVAKLGVPFKWTSEETQKAHSENVRKALTGKQHPWQDKINKNPAKIAKAAATHRGMKRSEEAKANMSTAAIQRCFEIPMHNKGKKVVHNPITKEILYLPKAAPIPESFVFGTGISTKGGKWIHNPITKQIFRLFDGELPEGFVFGRGPKRKKENNV